MPKTINGMDKQRAMCSRQTLERKETFDLVLTTNSKDSRATEAPKNIASEEKEDGERPCSDRLFTVFSQICSSTGVKLQLF